MRKMRKFSFVFRKQFFNPGASHFDGIPEDLMEIFDPHWGKFPPQVNINKINN